jgi:D-3-phosphoglycerate dehydrogenase / 2-oxoglutarate reductase
VPKRVVIAAEADPAFVERISADRRFSVASRPSRAESDLIEAAGDAEVLVTRHSNRVTRAVVAAAPALELVAQGTSGIDNIDARALETRGIALINVPGENANAVAELVIGHLIALTRTVPQYGREVRGGIWRRDDCATRHELGHYRLGIVGLGRVGGRVADLAHGFGIRVAAYDPYIAEADFRRREAARAVSLEEILRGSEIVSLHVPLTDETRGLVGERQLALLSRGSILINTSRGEVLDTRAALQRLEDGRLGGMALDVYDPEPPAIVWPDDPRLILTPHIAGCTFESKQAIGVRLYERICEHYGWSAPDRS